MNQRRDDEQNDMLLNVERDVPRTEMGHHNIVATWLAVGWQKRGFGRRKQNLAGITILAHVATKGTTRFWTRHHRAQASIIDNNTNDINCSQRHRHGDIL
jgi:hypothetical protein